MKNAKEDEQKKKEIPLKGTLPRSSVSTPGSLPDSPRRYSKEVIHTEGKNDKTSKSVATPPPEHQYTYRLMFQEELGACGKCVKYAMIICNVVTMVTGLVCLAIGLWVMLDESLLIIFLGEKYANLYDMMVDILFATGGLVVLCSIFGCIGAIKEVPCMLMAYFIVLAALFLTAMVGGIICYILQVQVYDTMEMEMKKSFNQYNTSPEIQEAWDAMQKYLYCCGYYSPADWTSVPLSCCANGMNDQGDACRDQPLYHQNGCLAQLSLYLNSHAGIITSSCVIIAALMVVGMVFSCGLLKFIRRKQILMAVP